MTQEEKQLLLKDLCSRLPYGVKGLTLGSKTCILIMLMSNGMFKADTFVGHITSGQFKPYLRPMSSMADEEKENLQSLHDIISDENYGDGYSPSAWDAIAEWEDYCNSRHLDYRGLIEKGLALEAPEGMYKTE